MLLIASKSYGQTSLDSVLVNIEKNNKTIVANTRYWEAKNLEHKTRLAPSNPKVDYDYLIGTPYDAGNQTEFAITQSFDFPAVYSKKRALSDEQIKQAEFKLTVTRQDVLLEAKLVCIELIYRNKLNSKLSLRQQNTEKWPPSFQIGLEKGGSDIMDVNKAKLQLVELGAELLENYSMINQLNQMPNIDF